MVFIKALDRSQDCRAPVLSAAERLYDLGPVASSLGRWQLSVWLREVRLPEAPSTLRASGPSSCPPSLRQWQSGLLLSLSF